MGWYLGKTSTASPLKIMTMDRKNSSFWFATDRSIPAISIEKYMRLATDEKYLTPPHNSYEELEELYWKENLDETKLAPIYGADVESPSQIQRLMFGTSRS